MERRPAIGVDHLDLAPASGTYSKIGDNPVNSSVVAVITRFGLRRPIDLLLTYRDYRRVAAEAQSSNPSGFLRSAFLVESLRSCFVLSLWESYDAIPRFGTYCPEHVHAARRGIGRCKLGANGGPELWSTKWRLNSVSNNLSWDDFDLRARLIGFACDDILFGSDRSRGGFAR